MGLLYLFYLFCCVRVVSAELERGQGVRQFVFVIDGIKLAQLSHC